jgi:hypothetical protein
MMYGVRNAKDGDFLAGKAALQITDVANAGIFNPNKVILWMNARYASHAHTVNA